MKITTYFSHLVEGSVFCLAQKNYKNPEKLELCGVLVKIMPQLFSMKWEMHFLVGPDLKIPHPPLAHK